MSSYKANSIQFTEDERIDNIAEALLYLNERSTVEIRCDDWVLLSIHLAKLAQHYIKMLVDIRFDYILPLLSTSKKKFDMLYILENFRETPLREVFPFPLNGLKSSKRFETLAGNINMECYICKEDSSASELAHIGCGHYICNTCWGNYIRTSSLDGPNILLLKCPRGDLNCDHYVTPLIVQELAISDEIKKAYSNAVRDLFILQHPRIHYCPNTSCSKLLYTHYAKEVTCPGCSQSFDRRLPCHCGTSFANSNCSHIPLNCTEHMQFVRFIDSESIFQREKHRIAAFTEFDRRAELELMRLEELAEEVSPILEETDVSAERNRLTLTAYTNRERERGSGLERDWDLNRERER